MSLRRPTTAAVVVCVALLMLPTAAVAAAPLFVSAPAAATAAKADPLKNIPVTGTAANGRKLTGTFTVNHFVRRNGKEYAVGALAARVGKWSVSRSGVAIPVRVPAMSKASTTASPNATAAATCSILHLVLGPLTLTLLGLNINLNQVILDITGTTGAGNLLGNLLCGIAGLLDGTGLPLSEVNTLLNVLNQLLSIPGALGL